MKCSPRLTVAAEGGLFDPPAGSQIMYAPDGSVVLASPAKDTREFDGRVYVLEEAIRTGERARLALAVKAKVGFHDPNYNAALWDAIAIING